MEFEATGDKPQPESEQRDSVRGCTAITSKSVASASKWCSNGSERRRTPRKAVPRSKTRDNISASPV